MQVTSDSAGRQPSATRGRQSELWYSEEIPPSIRLDEPTILNKERIGQRSEARKRGI